MSDSCHVVLVHGLWYRAWSLWVLERRLAAEGFRVRLFSYPTRTRRPHDNALALADFVRESAGTCVHFVAHSLGGLLLQRMLRRDGPPERGRVVLLGTPLGGSAVARRLGDGTLGRTLLGHALGDLQTGSSGLAPGWETGMIAGVRPVGLGRLTATLDLPHDGTVTVAETRDPALADHLQLPVTHTGMLVSGPVARAAAYFLHHGRFEAGE